MQEQIHSDYFTIAIFSITFFIALIYLMYFSGNDESFTDVWTFLKIFAYCTLAVGFLFIFALEFIVVYITMGTETGSESWIFMVINVLLMGMYLVAIGVGANSSGGLMRYSMLFCLVLISLSGFGYLGLLIEFRKPISDYLLYRFYQSNSTHGIFFFTFNFVLFLLIYFISFFTEHEKE